MTEAVSLGELLHEEALLVYQVGVPRGRLYPSGLCLSAIYRVVLAWPDPLPTGLNGDGKNVQTLWWAELDRLHSMTRAHPPLLLTQPNTVHRAYLTSHTGWLAGERSMSSGCSVDSGGWPDQCGQNCVHKGNLERSKFHRMVLLKNSWGKYLSFQGYIQCPFEIHMQ